MITINKTCLQHCLRSPLIDTCLTAARQAVMVDDPFANSAPSPPFQIGQFKNADAYVGHSDHLPSELQSLELMFVQTPIFFPPHVKLSKQLSISDLRPCVSYVK